MLRSFRAQLVVSFFLVILITPLLFVVLFYPAYGRYVLARKVSSPMVDHLRVVADAIEGSGTRDLRSPEIAWLVRAAAQGTPFRWVLLDRERRVLVDTRAAPGYGSWERKPRVPEVDAVLKGAPESASIGPQSHRAAVPIVLDGKRAGALLIWREFPRPSPFEMWSPGRYVRPGRVDSPLQNHAYVLANVLARECAEGMPLAKMERLLRTAAEGTAYRFVLIDGERRVLVDTESAPGKAPAQRTLRLPETDAVLRGAPGSTGMEGYVHRAAVPVMAAGQPVGVLLVSREFRAPSPFDPLALLIRAGVCLVIAGVLGVLLSRRLLRPVEQLTRAADALAAGDLAQRVKVPPHGELGHLAERFNRMARHLEELVTRLSGEHERLRAAHAELAESERRQRELVANVSHELRTPLACIQASVEALLDGMANTEEKRQRCLRAIEAETASLSRLVSDLLTLSRIDQGEFPLRRERVEVPRLLERCAERFSARASANGVALGWQCPDGLAFDGDEERMAQVLSNLVDNALRHTREGNRVHLEAAAENGHIRIEVTDNGCGIAPEHLPYVFERLYRAERSRSKTSGGAGLGLAIAREITEAHGGRIAIESTPGEGTTVTITLDACSASP